MKLTTHIPCTARAKNLCMPNPFIVCCSHVRKFYILPYRGSTFVTDIPHMHCFITLSRCCYKFSLVLICVQLAVPFSQMNVLL
jgi:hypothetical protein